MTCTRPTGHFDRAALVSHRRLCDRQYSPPPVDAVVQPVALLEASVEKREAGQRAGGGDTLCTICLKAFADAQSRSQPFECSRYSYNACWKE
mmetsp:Transcript_74935/g.124933  ORF Transcript_74935/g.124933 Transcript_74935/m.124933 type:complete len:92 (-) Transcript_74935:209-484(-)